MGEMSQHLPATGLYCVALKIEGYDGYTHRWYTSLEDVQLEIDRSSKKENINVFLAQASFKSSENGRKQANVHRVRAFWMDIDCGEKQVYKTQKDGVNALGLFLELTGLPRPTIINSGNGLYTRWSLIHEILPDQWVEIARLLKALCHAHEFKADDSRTADHASVLRPAGAINRKRGEAKEVKVLWQSEPVEFTEFANKVRDAAAKKKLKTEVFNAPKHNPDMDEFTSGLTQAPSCSIEMVSEKCAQIAYIKEKKGDVSEPLWYAFIGMARYGTEGRELIHEWSSGHSNYTAEETDKKIDQHEKANIAPTTCYHFGQINAQSCIGCRHKDKVKTPLVLGREITATEIVTEETPDRIPPPRGYMHTEDGLVFVSDEDTIRFYPHDIYPRLIAADSSMGVETVVFRHHLPHEGWQEFSMRSSLVRDQKAFFMALQDNHVGISGKAETNLMHDYLQRYMNNLRNERKIAKLYDQQGWKQDGADLAFVLGDRLIHKDRSVEVVGLAANVPDVAKHITCKGSAEEWTKTISETFYGIHEMEFAIGTAFGSILMQFTGYEGLTIALIGESGLGKTLVSRTALSVYGYFPELMMSQEDTRNALISRLGIYKNLPFAIDEVSNIDPMELSDLVYRITQGRDKARLNRAAVERPNNNQWRTIALVSSNHSLVDKLGAAKSDASAEMNRVFEYTVIRNPKLTKEVLTAVHTCILNNYGVIGEMFIAEVAATQHVHAENLAKLTEYIDKKSGAPQEERFMSAGAAAVIYGLMIANKMGLVKFDIQGLTEWVIQTTIAQRGLKKDLQVDSVSILGQFIDQYTSNIIVISDAKNQKGAAIHRDPRGSIYIRFETDTNKMYISRNALKAFLDKTYGSYNKLKADLEEIKALKRHDSRKVLGANCAGYGGASQYVWEIDLTAEGLGNIISDLQPREAGDNVIDFTVRKNQRG